MSSYKEQKGIYLGSRGSDFKALINSVLKKGNLKKKYRKMLTDEYSMEVYASAFTSELVDPDNNYQVLEQIGDLTGNKFIVNYMYEKFPQLNCAEGVKVVARLRINYGAKQSFSEIARKLGFWQYISATNDLRERKMKPLLEDVFEAFLGATERILDRKKRVGVGYAIVYDILATIFDEMDISLRYEDLYDNKTRLKELFDLHEDKLGPLVYKEQKREMITISSVFRVDGGRYQERPDGSLNKKRIVDGRYIKIGEGSAALKADAQQNAAAVGLATLNKQGWSKPVPPIYRRFNDGEDKKVEVYDTKKIIQGWGEDMNVLQSTKENTKYQSKYQSTPLAAYCRDRSLTGVEACMKLGADPNIPDSEGLTPTDLLFIGKVDEKAISDILTTLSAKGTQLQVSKQVKNMYISSYVSDFIDKVVVVAE
jgi:dsRNA-specific ribonuclease